MLTTCASYIPDRGHLNTSETPGSSSPSGPTCVELIQQHLCKQRVPYVALLLWASSKHVTDRVADADKSRAQGKRITSWVAAGEMRPPLTVVLINNSGGGIFSFLPIANDMDEDVFTQLWSTPQNVDLVGKPLASVSCW